MKIGCNFITIYGNELIKNPKSIKNEVKKEINDGSITIFNNHKKAVDNYYKIFLTIPNYSYIIYKLKIIGFYMYEMKTIIGTSQIDKDGLLKTSSIFDIMQDCSFFQLESENELTNYFNENNVSMFLISRQVDIYKLPKYSEKIITRTYVYECNEVYGYRNTVIYDENNIELVVCYAIGGFVNLTNSNLVRIPKSIIDGVKFDKKIEMNYLPRKIKFDNKNLKEIDRFKVKKYFIDDNNHVNNARYIDMVIDYVEDYYKRIRIEYRVPAKLGDTIIVNKEIIEDKIVIKLCSENNITYAIVEFSYNL